MHYGISHRTLGVRLYWTHTLVTNHGHWSERPIDAWSTFDFGAALVVAELVSALDNVSCAVTEIPQ